MGRGDGGEPTLTPTEPKPPIKWSDQEEYLLSLWADRALCYKMLHEDAQRIYKRQHMWFSIPVIILATLAGTANVAIASYVPNEHISTAQLVIGAVNLFCGVLSTLSNYFRAAEKCESHRNASVGWGKLYRSIFVELSLAREKRKPVSDFMRLSKNEYDRLTDNDPSLRSNVFKDFVDKVAMNNSVIILPEECGNLMHTSSWEHVASHRVRVMESRGSVIEEKNMVTGPIKMVADTNLQQSNRQAPHLGQLTSNPLFQMGQAASSLTQSASSLSQQAPMQPEPVQAPLPVQALPVQALPVQALPVQALPVQALPVQALPVQALPVQALPVQALPVQATAAMPLQTPRPQVSAPQLPQQKAQVSVVEVPAVDVPAVVAAVKVAAVEVATSIVPVVEVPAVEVAAVEVAAVEVAAVEEPAVVVPAVVVPAVEESAVVVPAVDVPAVVVPAIEVPAVEDIQSI
jgi:hypothetical protein